MTNLVDQIKNLSPAQRALLEQKLKARGAGAAPALHRRQEGDPRVLSCAQQQLWFLDQLAPGGGGYNVPFAVHLRGPLDVEALRKALHTIVGRHEVLRTMYLPYQGKVIPAVAKQWSVELKEVDLRRAATSDYAQDVLPQLQEFAGRSFDMARDLKLRAALYRLSDEKWIFLHISHHIAWDLHSRVVFYRELEQYYRGFRQGAEVALLALPLQYGDYALWQRKHLQGETLSRLETYWKTQLTGAPPALNLPTDYPRPAVQKLQGTRHPLRLRPMILETARVLARDHKVTLYMTLLAVFYVFLHGYSGAEDISVGSPFDERRHAETEPLIGMFINTLVLRTRLEGDLTFRQFLQRVREVVLGAIAHQELPFEKIVDAVQPPRDLSRMTLFQVNFRLQGAAAPPLTLADMEVESCTLIDNGTAKFDLALELPSLPESEGYVEYNTSLFKPETAQRMADDIQRLLCDLLAQPDIPLSRLESVRMLQERRGA